MFLGEAQSFGISFVECRNRCQRFRLVEFEMGLISLVDDPPVVVVVVARQKSPRQGRQVEAGGDRRPWRLLEAGFEGFRGGGRSRIVHIIVLFYLSFVGRLDEEPFSGAASILIVLYEPVHGSHVTRLFITFRFLYFQYGVEICSEAESKRVDIKNSSKKVLKCKCRKTKIV